MCQLWLNFEVLQSRNLSIDVLRGLTVAFMIIVNTPGSFDFTYAPLLHANWHGFTPTDLVFPTFLFVVGNSMSFSFSKNQRISEGAFLQKVFTRAALIFLVGYFLFWFPFVKYAPDGVLVLKPFETTRIFGVLQRIALAYLVASLLIHYLSGRALVWFSFGALVLYRLVLLWFGDMTLEGNAALKLDRWILGEAHMYHGEGIAFDPEGILSTLPSVVNVLIGYWAAWTIQRKGATYETVAHLMVAGVALTFFGLSWDLFFPINKKLWTSSFVLYTSGIDLLILATLLFVIDIHIIRSWTSFFEVLGKNPLVIYVLSELIVILLLFFRVGDARLYDWIYQNIFQPLAGDYMGSLLFALSVLGICWSIGYLLDRRKIYIKF